MKKYFENFDFTDFWDDCDYSKENYIEEYPSDELIQELEIELGGYKLPQSYIELMRSHNGGLLEKCCFPTEEPNGWAEDHVMIEGLMGIGREKTYSLLGEQGSDFMIEEWGYPEIGICIAYTPSAGHEMIMLDYSLCGKQGEPRVVYIDQEDDYQMSVLAENFEDFVKGLVSEDEFEEE